MYKILLDQTKIFECDIKIQGASADNTKVRLVLETENYSISFKGEINDGKVKIPISKLKNILKENYKGKIALEVIAEDTFFVPWEETYETDVHRKVEVSFNNEKPLIKETKVSVTAVPSQSKKLIEQVYAEEILGVLNRSNSISLVRANPYKLIEVMSHYFVKKNIDINKNMKKIEKTFSILTEKIVYSHKR